MKHVMNLPALQDFMLVAQHGGISAAARASGRSKATLSRQVARLEDELQVRLVERGARQIRLTAEGSALQARASELLIELGELGQAIRGTSGEPEGRLRLSAPMLFSHVHLGSIAAAFLNRYPAVVLDAHVEDRRVDLVGEGFDVVIRVNPPATHGLVGRCFLEDNLVLVASPSVESRSREHPLEAMPAVELSSGAEEEFWSVTEGDDVRHIARRVTLKLPNYTMIRTAVLDHAGAAAIPQSIVNRDLRSGALVKLGRIESGATQIWVLHTARRLTSLKVRAFVEFLTEWFADADRQSSLETSPGNPRKQHATC